MSTTGIDPRASLPLGQTEDEMGQVARELDDLFDAEFAFWNAQGELLRASHQYWLAADVGPADFGDGKKEPSIQAVAADRVRLTIPVVTKSERRLFAVADFPIASDGTGTGESFSKNALLRMARTGQRVLQQTAQLQTLDVENEELLQRMSAVFEEINLIYGVTKNLTLDNQPEVLGVHAMRMMQGTLPVRGVGLWLVPEWREQLSPQQLDSSSWLTIGECPIDQFDLHGVLQQHASPDDSPVVLNVRPDRCTALDLAGVTELVFAPIGKGDHKFGWIAAVNHQAGEELGTEEVGVIASVAALLAIHAGNRDLYQQQSEMVASVVTSLASTVDAKDPYTHGHSERVAIISRMLAEELGWTVEALDTIHMAGLLHDIGKIGIHDDVLQKPGRLTDEEFEQIKQHPQLGFEILHGIKELADILPAVLHHHENWDGTGYPHQLAGEEIPEIARIMAVADAYDAMTSNRPYRNGMPLEKVEAIFRDGADQQWDGRVIDAYFRISHEVEKASADSARNQVALGV